MGTDVTRLRTVVTTPRTDVSISSALSYVPARMNVPVTRSVRTTSALFGVRWADNSLRLSAE